MSGQKNRQLIQFSGLCMWSFNLFTSDLECVYCCGESPQKMLQLSGKIKG